MHALHDLQSLLARYTEMLALAEANDWAALADVGADSLRIGRALERAGALLQYAEPEDLPALRDTLQKLLTLDAKIREHTLPCLASTRKLLASSIKTRNVRSAYGA